MDGDLWREATLIVACFEAAMEVRLVEDYDVEHTARIVIVVDNTADLDVGADGKQAPNAAVDAIVGPGADVVVRSIGAELEELQAPDVELEVIADAVQCVVHASTHSEALLSVM